jgi:HK97 family phage portal protein
MPASLPAYSLTTLGDDPAPPPYAANEPAQVARRAALRFAAISPPGTWTSDRYAQVAHFTGLVYCAVKAKRDALVAATVTVTRLRRRKKRLLKAVSAPRPHARDEDRVPVDEADLLGWCLQDLFNDPNGQDTSGDLLGDLVVQQDLHGVAYLWHPLNKEGRPAELHVLPASAVQYLPPSGLYPQGGYTFTFAGTFAPLGVFGSGGMVQLDKREVLEIRDKHPRLSYGTWGPLDAGAEWVDLARGIDISQKKAFDNGFSPDVIISVDGATSDTIDAVEAQIKARYEGRDGRKVLVADGTGVKAEKLNTAPREMDYAASKDPATKQVLALFGVNSTVAGLTDADSYASLYAKLRQFYGGTLANLTGRWNQVLTKHLARPFYGPQYAIEISVPTPDDPDRLDKQRSDAVQGGYMTVNEARGQLDLDPWADGDVPAFEFQGRRQQAYQPQPADPMAGGGAGRGGLGSAVPPADQPADAPRPENKAGKGSLPNRLKAMSACDDAAGGSLVPPAAVAKKRKRRRAAERYAARLVKSLGAEVVPQHAEA